MSLPREDYNKLMLEYSQVRDRHRRELELRRKRVYAKLPRYQELDREIPEISYASLQEKLSGAAPSFLLGNAFPISQRKRKSSLPAPVSLRIIFSCSTTVPTVTIPVILIIRNATVLRKRICYSLSAVSFGSVAAHQSL